MLSFERRRSDGREDAARFDPAAVVIAGWAGRDEASVRHHIAELAAIGVPPPSAVPLFYRAAPDRLTQAPRIVILGSDTSGEAEPVIVADFDGLWLTVGSDHTDRAAETIGVALSKQLCPKPVARTLWRLDDVVARYDDLILRSYATIDGQRVLYQDGRLSELRSPQDLIARHAGAEGLALGTVLFGGTVPAHGGIRPATIFEVELHDPGAGRTIRHAYAIDTLPIVV